MAGPGDMGAELVDVGDEVDAAEGGLIGASLLGAADFDDEAELAGATPVDIAAEELGIVRGGAIDEADYEPSIVLHDVDSEPAADGEQPPQQRSSKLPPRPPQLPRRRSASPADRLQPARKRRRRGRYSRAASAAETPEPRPPVRLLRPALKDVEPALALQPVLTLRPPAALPTAPPARRAAPVPVRRAAKVLVPKPKEPGAPKSIWAQPRPQRVPLHSSRGSILD
eukprot:TRINITY_DN23791_c0_g1_i1.p1 TRINITY_DN23791_c0_g1~~TRINITY_DN23791_c0_g1_i1.p1  ORF type:complete len:240 (+),score=91.22 TRINITY_DN23791_c0_g1_i1:44-721(+)